MNKFEKKDTVIDEAELIVVESEIKDMLNDGIKVCCPNCHSPDYEVYPTGQLGLTIERPEEDIHFFCSTCRYIWNSEFCGDRYNYRESCLTGQFKLPYQNKRTNWFKKWQPEIVWIVVLSLIAYTLMKG